ncbi:MAG: CPBP family intramembrane metalloprotease [Candidatus Omnitrophica bacterium]|nr:CPBP family intramembrane metalloprotease [Candidatus Omnitrophota bacterium]
MGGFIFLFVMIGVIYIDARSMQQKDSGLYRTTVKSPPVAWALFSFLFFIVVGPIYYYLRRRFLEGLELKREEDAFSGDGPPVDQDRSDACEEHFSCVMESTGVVIRWFFILVCVSLAYAALALFFPNLNSMLVQFVIVGQITSLSMLFLIYQVIKKNRVAGFWKSLSVVKVDRFWIKAIVIPVVAGCVMAAINYAIISSRGTDSPSPLGQAMVGSDGLTITIFFLLAILSAPLVEELIFRGYFYATIAHVKGKVYAFVVISLLFASIHIAQLWGDWLGIGAIFFLGFCLTFLRYWSGTTVASMIAHFVYNTSIVIIPLVFLVTSSPSFFEYTWKYSQLDFIQKEELLLTSLEEDPDFPAALNALAWLYAEQHQDLERALELVEKALTLEPNTAAYLDTKAEVLYQLDRCEEAAAIESKLVEQFPVVGFYQEQLEKFEACR